MYKKMYKQYKKKLDNLNHFGLSNNNFRPKKIFFNLQGFGTVTAKKTVQIPTLQR